MPELPEVETVRRLLEQRLLGKTIQAIDIFYTPIVHEDLETFKRTLIGQTIETMERRGKYLLFKCTTHTLISHLRMEGRYALRCSSERIDHHDHVAFHFTDGSTLFYRDVRKFGTMDLRSHAETYTTLPLSKLGVEPFKLHYHKKNIASKLTHKQTSIKAALLDQHIIAGLGNIYVDEVCFKTGVHPLTPAHRLAGKKLDSLLSHIEEVINKAISLGGSTIRTYQPEAHMTGRFQNELCVHMRKEEPCPTCQTPIIKTKVSGRGTYFCPQCQRY